MSDTKIDKHTLIPLGWVLSLFSVGISITGAAAFKVKSVDDRLARIEEVLRIHATAAPRNALGKPEALALAPQATIAQDTNAIASENLTQPQGPGAPSECRLRRQ